MEIFNIQDMTAEFTVIDVVLVLALFLYLTFGDIRRLLG